MTTYWCERAWLGDGRLEDRVAVEVHGSRIASVITQVDAPPAGAFRLAGLTIPGFANCHSHAFHRALRGRTQRERGTFWTWRDTMYDVAARLDPDSYYDLAHAVYREMLLTGITAVGEFHYLHHDRDGRQYADANAMGAAVIQAARDAGIRITLLDACYLSSGFGAPVQGVQGRFSDGTADDWAVRVEALAKEEADDVVVGSAIHSVRAVPRDDLSTVAGALPDAPLHLHLSEQQAENDGCLALYGVTPTGLLADAGALSDRLSAVHATHLTDGDIDRLGRANASACFCPTTERDLADGVGPAHQLVESGCSLTLGSDSHAVVDLFEEMRAIELDERLVSQRRGTWRADDLLRAASVAGHQSLGYGDAGRIAVGYRADLVTLDVRTPRTAGTGAGAETAVFAAGPGDITHLVADGRRVVLDPEGVGALLDRAIGALVTP
jgi:formiminoglutamate deiminase